MAADLTTLSNVKAYLRLTATTDDALLGRLITAASEWVRKFVERDITEGTYTLVLDGTGGPKICVPHYPVTEITAMSVDGVAVALASLVARGALITRTDGGKFTKGLANVTVTFKAGFATVPADIDQATVQIVAWRYKEMSRIGEASKSAGGQETISYQITDVPRDVRTLLQSWRKVMPV